MVDHLTPGIGSADTRARVNAFLTDACSAQAALRADYTLRPAVGRTSNEVSLARANTGPIHLPLLTV